MIRINDLFWTFQGEGFHSGRRALFVRLPFCNLKCSWCDTEFNTFTKMSEDEFKAQAILEKSRFAVITGGEPTINKDAPKVIEWLKELGFEIAIESNGMFPVPGGIDWITISPKKDSDYFIHPFNAHMINEIKVVVDEGFDFKVLEAFESIYGSSIYTRLTLSPEYNTFHASFEAIQEFIKEHPQWKYSLQTYKWLGIR
jgi:organic radical activating enzyme